MMEAPNAGREESMYILNSYIRNYIFTVVSDLNIELI